MVKKLVFIILFATCLVADEPKNDVFEQNCVTCHAPLSIGLDKIYFRYLSKYSSELSVKSAMIDFLKNPNIQTTAMSEEQLRILGIKTKTHLSNKALIEAVDTYWDKYKVFGKLW